MNILNNYTATGMLLRPFISAQEGHRISEFTPYDLRRVSGPDPQYAAVNAFEYGYDIELTVVTCADLRDAAADNMLFEVAFTDGGPKVLQIGDFHGFRISSCLPPSGPNGLFIYTFTTVRPNKTTYILRSYEI